MVGILFFIWGNVAVVVENFFIELMIESELLTFYEEHETIHVKMSLMKCLLEYWVSIKAIAQNVHCNESPVAKQKKCEASFQ